MADKENPTNKGGPSLFERRKKTAPSLFMPKKTPATNTAKLGKVGEHPCLPAPKTLKPPGSFHTLDQDAIAELDKSREQKGLPTLKEPKNKNTAVQAPKSTASSQATKKPATTTLALPQAPTASTDLIVSHVATTSLATTASQASSASNATNISKSETASTSQSTGSLQTQSTPKATSSLQAINASQTTSTSQSTANLQTQSTSKATSSLQSNAAQDTSTSHSTGSLQAQSTFHTAAVDSHAAIAASHAAVAASQAAAAIKTQVVSITTQPVTVAAMTKELSDLSLGTPLPPTQPMLLSCPAYYDKRAYSIHEPISPVDSNMTGVTPRTPQFPSMAWFEDVKQFVANVTSSLANCKYEHPGANRQNGNPFSVLSSNNNNRGVFGKAASASDANSYSLNAEVIVKDLTEERPTWILSSYGPGRDAPEQLWGAPVEQSFEEMRLHYLMGAAAGNPDGAVSSPTPRGQKDPRSIY